MPMRRGGLDYARTKKTSPCFKLLIFPISVLWENGKQWEFYQTQWHEEITQRTSMCLLISEEGKHTLPKCLTVRN